MSDILTFVISVLVIFLAGVGVGTFVLGSRIRKVVAEAVAAVLAVERAAKADAQKAVGAVEQAFKDLKKA